MNKDYAFFDAQTGMFAQQVNMAEDDATIQDPIFRVVEIDPATFNENSRWSTAQNKIVDLPPKPSFHAVWDEAQDAWVDPRSQEQKAADLELIQAQKLWEINKSFETACKALTETYPETEKITWTMQQAEVFAWHANPQAETPFLSVVAETRGIDLNDLLEKTYQKVLQFQQYSAQLIGKRQRYEDAIYACTTEQEVQQIMWE